jgi:coproporphyrinogen III oxidase
VLPPPSPTTRPEIETWLADFQLRLCRQLEAADAGPARFLTDAWQREGGGGGRSKVLEHGRILEKGGVGFSAVWGQMSEAAARQLHMPDPAFTPPG